MAPHSLFAVARHLSREECEAIAKKVLSFSKADECRVTVNSGMRQNTRFAVNQISTAGDNYNVSVDIRSVIGKKVANVSVNRLDDTALREAVANSERIARLAPDDPELYCPNVEWDWGDGTRSEATENCEPFEDGKSTVKRRWTTSHTFDMQGSYRVVLRLKRGPKTIVAGNNTVQVKPGVRDMSPEPY